MNLSMIFKKIWINCVNLQVLEPEIKKIKLCRVRSREAGSSQVGGLTAWEGST